MPPSQTVPARPSRPPPTTSSGTSLDHPADVLVVRGRRIGHQRRRLYCPQHRDRGGHNHGQRRLGKHPNSHCLWRECGHRVRGRQRRRRPRRWRAGALRLRGLPSWTPPTAEASSSGDPEATTDANGDFSLPDATTCGGGCGTQYIRVVPQAAWSVTSSAISVLTGVANGALAIATQPAAARTLTITSVTPSPAVQGQTITVVVHLTDASGPVPNAHVGLTSRNGGAAEVNNNLAGVTTDGSGDATFTLRADQSGTTTLTASSPNAANATEGNPNGRSGQGYDHLDDARSSHAKRCRSWRSSKDRHRHCGDHGRYHWGGRWRNCRWPN